MHPQIRKKENPYKRFIKSTHGADLKKYKNANILLQTNSGKQGENITMSYLQCTSLKGPTKFGVN